MKNTQVRYWFLLSIVGLVIFVGAFLTLNYVHGQTVDNQTTVNSTDFSIDIPNNWSYKQDLFLQVHLTPSKYASLLTETEMTKSFDENIKGKDGGASAFLYQDWMYDIKNAPFDVYLEDKIGYTPRQNLTIDNEPAVRISVNGIESFNGTKMVQYLIWHDKKPYALEYKATVKDFEKYLPEFEQIVKTFKFREIK
jgi:hypothetical protein